MADEFEVKFYLRQLDRLRRSLPALGAQLAVERHLERNWRFDRPDGSLSARGEVLRLRTAPAASLAFKARTGQPERRLEIEFAVEDAQAGRDLLRALGFEQIGYYEKQREVYRLDEGRVMLDQLPFGQFVELEGPLQDWLRQAAGRLGLRWERRVQESYLELFQALRDKLAPPPQEASFDAFTGQPPLGAELLGLQDAEAGTQQLPPT